VADGGMNEVWQGRMRWKGSWWDGRGWVKEGTMCIHRDGGKWL